jgi:hypothetical protein
MKNKNQKSWLHLSSKNPKFSKANE